MSGDILNAGENVDDKKKLRFLNHFSKLRLQIQMNIQKKLLNLQHENMRPQRNIDINDRILDEKYQNIKIYDKNMMKEIRSVQLKRKK